MTEWWKVPDKVVHLAEELIALYHESLANAKIALIFRDEAPVTDGRATLGKAMKVSPQWKPLLKDQTTDFVIWLAYDRWEHLDNKQKRALLDHELCHCFLDHEGRAKIRGHDIEEFAVIIQRHGAWNDSIKLVQRAINRQLPLDFDEPPTGKVFGFGLDRPEKNSPLLSDETVAQLEADMKEAMGEDGVEVSVTLAASRETAVSEEEPEHLDEL